VRLIALFDRVIPTPDAIPSHRLDDITVADRYSFILYSLFQPYTVYLLFGHQLFGIIDDKIRFDRSSRFIGINITKYE